MKVKSLVNALTKLGLEIKVNSNGQYYCKGQSYVCSWYAQNENAICVNVRRHNDHHDSQSDYTAGSFAHTIKQAVKWIQEN